MKRLTLPLLLLISPASQANWSLQGFPDFSETSSGILTTHATLPKGQRTLELLQDNQCWQPADDVKRHALAATVREQSAG